MRKIVTIVCLFVFSFLFFNVDNAKAVTTCDYGIECKYSLDGLRESVGGGYLMGGGYLYVAFQCSDISKKFSECSKFTVYPVASKQDMSPSKFFETGGNPGEDLSISDESDILPSKINDFKSYFSSDKKFACPTLYYLSKDGLKVKFKKFGEGTTRISWTTDPLSTPGCVPQNTVIDIGKMQDQATEDAGHAYADSETGKNDDKDNDDKNITVDINTITAWAASQGYDVNSLGDPCSVISPKLQSLLNTIFWAISIIGIILVVVMTALSFIKAIVGSDDEKFRDAFRHLLTRIIVVIVLLLLPAILSFIITLINDSSTGEVTVGKEGNVFCDIAN